MTGRLLAAPRRVLAWSVLLVVLAALGGAGVADSLKTGRENFDDAGSESATARAALTAATGASPEADVVAVVRRPATTAAVVTALRADPVVATVAAPPALRSRDGSSRLVVASLRPMGGQQAQDASLRLAEEIGSQPGVQVGGPLLATAQIRDQVEADLRRAELVAFPLLLLLCLFVFRGVIAALLPVVVGAVSVVGTLFVLKQLAAVMDLSVFALNLTVALGLGLAIDYSLFVLSRYREETEDGGYGPVAMRRTLATAGRTVVFSAATVGLALLALTVFPQPFLVSMGLGGATVAAVSALAALVVLPALLLVLGRRIDALAPRRRRPAPTASAWGRLGAWAVRRPARVALAAAAVLVLAGVPLGDVRFTGFDASVLPADASARQVADRIAADFRIDRTTPMIVAVSTTDREEAEQAARAAAAAPGIVAVTPPVQAGDGLFRVDAFADGPPLAAATQTTVKDLRSALAGTPADVTGEAARFADGQAALSARLPAALLVLVAASVVLLFLMTGSVIIPLLGLVMNVLTVAAALGVLKLVFQDGRLEDLLAFSSQGGLDASQMVLVFVLVFALSTDYGVFLLSRIKETVSNGTTSRDAVVTGLDRTGRLITAAALLFCVAIGAFATSEIVFIKQVGIGTAVAVLVDATIVRGLLLPALLGLLGDRAWWAPRPLRSLHDRFGLREGPEPLAVQP